MPGSNLLFLGDMMDDLIQHNHLIVGRDDKRAKWSGRYMGIDPSLTSTGVAVVDELQMRTHLLQPGDGRTGLVRLEWLREETRAMVEAYRPRSVAIEGYAFGRANRAHHMGEWGGVLRMLLWDMGYSFWTVPPSSLKKFVTGSGKGSKAPIMLGLFKNWSLDVNQEDRADGAALAMAALYLDDPHGGSKASPARYAYQDEALGKAELTVTAALAAATDPERPAVRVRRRK